MKHKLHYIILNLFIVCQTSNAQNFILYGDRAFGGAGAENFPGILNIGNNQFILSCESSSDVSGDKTDPLCDQSFSDIWVLKIDTGFNILWNNSLGGEGGESDNSIIKAGINKIIFIADSYSDSACEKSEHSRDTFASHNSDYWICMLDSSGNKIWDKSLGGTDEDFIPKISQLSSGDFIVAGSSQSPVSGDKTVINYGGFDYWVVKLDSAGNKLWDNVYGGTGDEVYSAGYESETLSILPDSGDDFILAGTTNSPLSGSISDTSRGDYDIWIVKSDSGGNKIWDKRYGGSGMDRNAHIIHTNDNGYILCGTTDSPQGLDVSDTSKGIADVWVIKLDSLGNKQWDKRYGGNKEDVGQWIEKAPGGGYWVSGYTASDSGLDVSEPPYYTIFSGKDYWIFKIDSTGNKIWDKRFGGPSGAVGTNFAIMPDSSIYLCGRAVQGTSAVKTDWGRGGADIWVVHFKYTDNSTGINENKNVNKELSIYPNPTKAKIVLTSPFRGQGAVYIHDVMGKEVFYKKDIFLNHYEINISDFDKGVYFLNVKTGESIFTKKLVKL